MNVLFGTLEPHASKIEEYGELVGQTECSLIQVWLEFIFDKQK